MGDNSYNNRNLEVVLNVSSDATKKCDESSIEDYVPLLQKVDFLKDLNFLKNKLSFLICDILIKMMIKTMVVFFC